MPEPDPQDPKASVAAAPVAPAPVAAPAAPVKPAPAAPGENSAIRQMRDALTTKNDENTELREQLATAQGKVTEGERKDMADVERVTSERDEALEKLKGHDDTKTELAALSTAMEASYDKRLEAVDEKHRENVKALSKDGNWADRLTKLDSAIALLPQPQSVGSSGQPGAPAAPEPAQKGAPTAPEPLGPEGLKKIAAEDGSIGRYLTPRNQVAAARARTTGNAPTVVRPGEAAEAANRQP